jgi:hypothetical protein
MENYISKKYGKWQHTKKRMKFMWLETIQGNKGEDTTQTWEMEESYTEKKVVTEEDLVFAQQ